MKGRLLAALGLGAAAACAARAAAGPDPYGGLDLFAGVLARVEQSWIEPVAPVDLVQAALGGLVTRLDPHSAWYPPEEAARVRDADAGVVVGAGLDGRPEGCGWRVTAVVEGGPAARAGLAPGDCVEAVDGAALAGLDEAGARSLLDRPEGVAIALRVLGPVGDRREVVVLCGRAQRPAVRAERVAPGVAWVRVERFRMGAATGLAAALAGQDRVLVDLRGNPGGELSEAVEALDLVLGAGEAVRTTGRAPGAVGRYPTTDAPSDWTGPLVVLVDRTTASAAEIFAGVLQERGRARLVGEPTWGKGTVQSVWAWPDGSALRLTFATWSLPSGRTLVEGDGLRPDRLVPGAAPADPAAALRARIVTAPGLRTEDRAAMLAELDRLHPLPAPPAERPFADRLREDPALAAAWEELRRAGP